MPKLPTAPDAALLALRLWIGLVGILHGSQKLFGAFDGPGLKGFAAYLDTLHVPAPMPAAVCSALAEFAGGVLIAAGILPRLAAIPFAFSMLIAWATAHHFQFFAQTGGGEYPLTLALAAAAIIIAGPGRYTMLPSSRTPTRSS
jgi:putative oxidoreductase